MNEFNTECMSCVMNFLYQLAIHLVNKLISCRPDYDLDTRTLNCKHDVYYIVYIDYPALSNVTLFWQDVNQFLLVLSYVEHLTREFQVTIN